MEQQQKRFNKLNYESFFLLKVEKNDLGFQLKVSGSTRNVYTIQINNNSRKIECDCPDSKSWARHYNCFCKHVCFVLLRMFKSIFNKQSSIFIDKTINMNDYNLIESKLINLNISEEHDIVDTDLLNKFHNLSTKSNSNNFLVENIEKEEMCPICFLDINGNEEKIVKCPECRNILHLECMEKWLEMGNKTCVYCRSNVWQNYNLKDEYLSLN